MFRNARSLPVTLHPTFQAHTPITRPVRTVQAQTHHAYATWLLICDALSAASLTYSLIAYFL